MLSVLQEDKLKAPIGMGIAPMDIADSIKDGQHQSVAQRSGHGEAVPVVGRVRRGTGRKVRVSFDGNGGGEGDIIRRISALDLAHQAFQPHFKGKKHTEY